MASPDSEHRDSATNGKRGKRSRSREHESHSHKRKSKKAKKDKKKRDKKHKKERKKQRHRERKQRDREHSTSRSRSGSSSPFGPRPLDQTQHKQHKHTQHKRKTHRELVFEAVAHGNAIQLEFYLSDEAMDVARDDGETLYGDVHSHVVLDHLGHVHTPHTPHTHEHKHEYEHEHEHETKRKTHDQTQEHETETEQTHEQTHELSLLSYASMLGHVSVCALLLSRGANINEQTQTTIKQTTHAQAHSNDAFGGYTALHYACVHDRFRVAALLVCFLSVLFCFLCCLYSVFCSLCCLALFVCCSCPNDD